MTIDEAIDELIDVVLRDGIACRNERRALLSQHQADIDEAVEKERERVLGIARQIMKDGQCRVVALINRARSPR